MSAPDTRVIKSYGIPPWADEVSIDGGPAISVRLIAAAPALLEALESVLGYWRKAGDKFGLGPEHRIVHIHAEHVKEILAAITQARGEQS